MGSSEYLRLETRGRRTNLPHIVELRYAWLGGEYFVLGNSPSSDWGLNALKSGKAKVRLGEYLVDVAARKADEAEAKAALMSFGKKYGARFVSRWYSHSELCLRLTPIGSAVRRGGASGELDVKADFGHWASQKKDYYVDVAGAFDSASDEYDFTIRRNFINTWIRKRSLQVLRKLLRPGDYLMEVGCGTGEEAIAISDWVSGIVATDVSAGMVGLLEEKVAARGLAGKILPMKLSASEISRVRDLIGEKEIRVAYSFNGALNCEPNLGSFVRQLDSLLEPDGYFVCSVRNTTCATEMISHGLVLQFDRANPRRVQPIMVSVGGRDVPSTYFSPSSFISYFSPRFSPAQVIALPALLPPAYLNGYYLRLRPFLSFLERLELPLSGVSPFNRLGDQTLFVFRKSSSEDASREQARS
ncbi:MAG: methyltransferase domain-containing protein [Nitrososphaerota archaeon]|nr:methyltransferase domain-containing protein [Nitrososphaerota archaeon]MDG6974997.1 methyltransferase domain-containing protein [Nitrososphaerota archaeon]